LQLPDWPEAAVASVAQAQQLPEATSTSWYVLIGKHAEPWSLCYAHIVTEKFKDGTYVEAQQAESAKREQDVKCKLLPLTDFEQLAKDQCDEAQESLKIVRELEEKRLKVAGATSLSTAEAKAESACSGLRPRYAGGTGGCTMAIKATEMSQVLTVTKRLGPYPTAALAQQALLMLHRTRDPLIRHNDKTVRALNWLASKKGQVTKRWVNLIGAAMDRRQAST
jgi:hypothetical protein